jgi:hypothetical protein
MLHGDSFDDLFHIATHRMPQKSGLFKVVGMPWG